MRKSVTEPGAPVSSNTTQSPSKPTQSAPTSTWMPNTSRHLSSSTHTHHHDNTVGNGNANNNTSTPSSATTTTQPSSGYSGGYSRAPAEPNPFRYTRDFMVGLYSPDLPLPDGCDLSDKILASDQILEPMANIPLTETEKKILAAGSINSEVARRGGPQGNRPDGKDATNNRAPQRPGMNRRGYDQRPGDRDGRRLSGQDGDENDESLWDTPSNAGGGFSANGVFSLAGGGDPDGKLKRPDPGPKSPNNVGSTTSAVPLEPTPPVSKDTGNPLMSPPRRAEEPALRSGLSTPAATPIAVPTQSANSTTVSSTPGARSAPLSATPIASSVAAMAPSIIQSTTRASTPPAGPTPIGATPGSIGRQQTDPALLQQQTQQRAFGSLFDPFAGLPGGIAGIGDSLLTSGQILQQQDPYATNILDNRRDLQPMAIPQPVQQPTVPPKWMYKDLDGNLQGPFLHTEMHDWYVARYLQPDLMVRHSDETTFEPLARLIQLYGSSRPFLADAEEYQRPRQPVIDPQRQRPFGGLGLVGAAAGGVRDDLYSSITPQASDVGIPSIFNPFGGSIPGSQPLDSYAATRRIQETYPGWSDPAVSSIGRGVSAGWVGPLGSIDPNRTMVDTRSGQAYYPTQQQQGLPYGYQGQQQQFGASALFGQTSQPAALFSPFGQTQQPQQQHVVPQSPINRSPIATPQPGKAASYAPSTGARTDEDAASQHDYAESTHGEDFGQFDEAGTPEHVSTTGWDDTASVASSISMKQSDRGKSQRDNTIRSAGTPTHERPTYSREEPRRQSLPQAQAAIAQAPQQQQQQQPIAPAAPIKVTPVWGAPATAVEQKLSLKEIQEIEQRDREIKERERQRRQALAAANAAANAMDSGSWAPGNTPWQAPSSKQKSLTEIMQEEEARKQKEAASRAATLAAMNADAPNAGGTRYADLVSTARGATTTGWATTAVQGRVVPANASVVAAPIPVAVRPLAPSPAAPISSGPLAAVAASSSSVTPASPAGAWNVVGKSGQVVGQVNVQGGPRPIAAAPGGAIQRPSSSVLAPSNSSNAIRSVNVASSQPAAGSIATARSAVASPNMATVTASAVRPAAAAVAGSPSMSKSSTFMERQGSNAPSEAFLSWCRQSLKPLERSTTAGVKVEDFLQILLSIPIGEASTLQLICDDTLGGLTAIDARKFADEFVRRRRSDREETTTPGGGSSRPSSANSMADFDTGNRFVVVNKKKQVKPRK
ncbi:hypothetical protein SmJEL517_g01056 [Synchytrium microbalum]|uniref:GYF domain-containing protein n=1 Tax=Synchytrium microbalum TaxID=1806994 RepID=A0A507C7X4_9FUNG|nr:uncharacterized protein SmJEL517_g01056 [Synchytrium microbalum]TPX37157.1 hypothetical protein SmJEL517_g01056 [Synchytrium microbalum]